MGITNIVIIVIDSGSYLKPFSRYPMNHVPHSYPSPRAIHFRASLPPWLRGPGLSTFQNLLHETWPKRGILYGILYGCHPYHTGNPCSVVCVYLYISLLMDSLCPSPRTGYIIQLHPIVGSISHEFSLYYPIKSAFNGCRIHLYSLTMVHQLYPPSMYRYSIHRPWIPHELPMVK